MIEPWELTEDMIHRLICAGVEEDGIERLTKKREETYHEMLYELYGDDPQEEAYNHFYSKYGFEHHCTCVDDTFAENTIEIPACRLRMGDDALEALENVLPERDELRDAVDELRRQVTNLGETPVV